MLDINERNVSPLIIKKSELTTIEHDDSADADKSPKKINKLTNH